MVATCSVDGCDRPGRNGKARLGKYCDVHIPEGILAGSVTSHKRQATSPAPSSSSTQVSSGQPDGRKLLEINKIFGSRLCDPTDPRFDDSDRDNGFPGVDFAQTLEYLALCKFERKESDSIGRITLLWLTVADMVESDLEDAAVDATLAAWETESARLRAEAVRAARAERS